MSGLPGLPELPEGESYTTVERTQSIKGSYQWRAIAATEWQRYEPHTALFDDAVIVVRRPVVPVAPGQWRQGHLACYLVGVVTSGRCAVSWIDDDGNLQVDTRAPSVVVTWPICDAPEGQS